MYIDVHCHLDLLGNIEKIIERAKKLDIEIIVANGINHETNRKILELCEKFPIVKAALGIYPIDALKMSHKGLNEEINFIKQNKDKISAIGEVGLDFKESDEIKEQEKNFLKFIALSKELDKPLIIHSRKAEDRCIEILEKTMAKKVIMHCFCGTKKAIKRIAENGWFLSVPANVNYNIQFQELVKETPIEHLLCETDSPFLHPEKGANNSPENVIVSYKKIAELKNLSLKDVEKKIENNYYRLFGK